MKAALRHALAALALGEVMVAKNRKNYFDLEAGGFAEQYTSDTHGVKVRKWRITPAGIEANKQNKAQ